MNKERNLKDISFVTHASISTFNKINAEKYMKDYELKFTMNPTKLKI